MKTTINTLKTITVLLTSFGTFAQNQQNTLQNAGNIGVGTTNPQYKLEVNGTTRLDSSLIVKDTSLFEKSVHVLENTTVEGEMRMQSDATVLQDLRVKGNTFLEQNLQLLGLADPNARPFEILMLDNDGFVSRGDQSKLLKFVYANPFPVDLDDLFLCEEDDNGQVIHKNPVWTNGPEILHTRLVCPESEIRVGINTNSPEARLNIVSKTDLEFPALKIDNENRTILQLDNNGLLRAREIRVDETNWPDYVFQDNYGLRTLEEVKAYILNHGHLPNVPSAEVVEKEGVNLGEMNKILIEKTEELTLYVIQLNEQAKKQQVLLEKQQLLIEQQQKALELLMQK